MGTRFYAQFFTDYADQSGDEFVIPEDLSALPDEELTRLHEQAASNFDAMYGDGQGLSDSDLEVLNALAEGLEAISAEVAVRETAAAERAEQAAQLAARVRPSETDEAETDEAEDETEAEDDEKPETDEAAETDEAEDEEREPEAVAASGRTGPTRVNLSGLRNRQSRVPVRRDSESDAPARMADLVLASGDGGYFASGTGLDWTGIGKAIDHRLRSYKHAQFTAAAASGRHIRQQVPIATISNPVPDDLIIRSGDREHVDEVFQRAMSESRLPGGSLVAAGGWCAPSETRYDLCEMESRDGLLSVPEIGIARGGINFSQGPDFSEIFSSTGFCATEAQAEAGEYAPGATPGDPNVVGDKPCYYVPCPEFDDVRLNLCGLCLQAGLLQARGYPEVIARTTRGALVAHDHRVDGNVIASLVTQSTAVTMTTGTVGTIAPILTAIELQVEHTRYVNRLPRSTSLEAVFPFWVRGAIRSDLALRQGVDLLSVTDQQIDGWFRQRGINPQFVYNWQALEGTTASAFTGWPDTVQFLLYPAGTFVKGTSDIITLDALYDSTLIAQNDYTALFTEEGWLVAKLCHDSRVVTVPICSTGMTGAGIHLECDGTETVVTP